MNATKSSHGFSVIAILVVLGVLYSVTAYVTGAGIVDDADVFLEYAWNIRAGAGPVFIVGEAVEGCSSPVWLVLLTVFWPTPNFPPAFAIGLSASVGFSTVAVLLLTGNDTNWRGAFIGSCFLASHAAFVYWAWSGMDTALFTVLVTATALMCERDGACRRMPQRTGLLLSSAILVRLKAVWLAPPILP